MTDSTNDLRAASSIAGDINPVFRLAVLFTVAALVLIPLLAAVLGGFKTLGELRVNPFGLPGQWQWSNYWDILAGERYWQMMGNSLIVAAMTVFLTVIVAAMAAFTFVHIRFFGSSFLFNYLLLGLMFPAATAVMPLFIKIRDLGLLDTYWGVVLPQVAFVCSQPAGCSLPAMVPVIINGIQNPVTSISRCLAFGELIADAVTSFDTSARVVMLVTGGLSHSVGESTMGEIDEAFDRQCIALLTQGDVVPLKDFLSEERIAQAGNGSSEVRYWAVAHGAAHHHGFELMHYEAVPEVMTGCGFAQWHD